MSARFATAILLCSFAHAQQASLPEPQYAHQFNAVVNGQPVVLERQTAVTDTKSHRFFVITPAPPSLKASTIQHPRSVSAPARTSSFVCQSVTGTPRPSSTCKSSPPAKKTVRCPSLPTK